MIRRIACVLAIVTAGAACSGDGSDASERLTTLANAGDTLTYSVVYGFTLSGPLAEAVTTAMEIRQLPPTSWRRFATTTLTKDEKRVTNTQWFVQGSAGDFVCFATGDEDVKCQPTVAPPLFGYEPVDEVFARAREAEGFVEVERLQGRTVAGRGAECFRAQARPLGPTTPPSPEPRFAPTRYAYDICYTADGILVYARQEIIGDGGGELSTERRSSVLEARSVSRSVAPSDVGLPGPVTVTDPA